MKGKILGRYTVRKTGNANSVTLPISSGFSTGDKVILILRDNGNVEIEKQKKNFWSKVPELTRNKYQQDLKDLGYDPLNQKPVGKERIE